MINSNNMTRDAINIKKHAYIQKEDLKDIVCICKYPFTADICLLYSYQIKYSVNTLQDLFNKLKDEYSDEDIFEALI